MLIPKKVLYIMPGIEKLPGVEATVINVHSVDVLDLLVQLPEGDVYERHCSRGERPGHWMSL